MNETELAAAEQVLADCIAWAMLEFTPVAEPTHPAVKAVKRLREEADAAARVKRLYTDALGAIAGYPLGENAGRAGSPAQWMRSKALEALEKTEAAERGEIYAQVTSYDPDVSATVEERGTVPAPKDALPADLKSVFEKLAETMDDPVRNQALRDAVKKKVQEQLREPPPPRTQRIPFEPFEHRCSGISRAEVAEMIAVERGRLIAAMEKVSESNRTTPPGPSASAQEHLAELVAELRKAGA